MQTKWGLFWICDECDEPVEQLLLHKELGFGLSDGHFCKSRDLAMQDLSEFANYLLSTSRVSQHDNYLEFKYQVKLVHSELSEIIVKNLFERDKEDFVEWIGRAVKPFPVIVDKDWCDD